MRTFPEPSYECVCLSFENFCLFCFEHYIIMLNHTVRIEDDQKLVKKYHDTPDVLLKTGTKRTLYVGV